MHARHLALRFGVDVLGKRNYGRAYIEPRTRDRDQLLAASYGDALSRWKRQSDDKNDFFFIEDTSVKILSLSTSGEVPGTDVKFWMRDMTFRKVDRLLKAAGNDRRVEVRSDVVLHLPEHFRERHGIAADYLIFSGTVSGTIVERAPKVVTNLLYPWLDDRSFNKWFAPGDQKKALSAMSIDDADLYDFRKGSIGAMLSFLESHGALAKVQKGDREDVQDLLPMFAPPVLLATGLPCAGKTTLGEHLSEHFGYYHLEASDFMKRAFFERHGRDSGLSIHEFAEDALRATPDIVVSQILTELRRRPVGAVIITGFRSPDEVRAFRERFPGPNSVSCLFIESDSVTRYQRSLKRNRKDAAGSEAEFQQRDELQLRMGLQAIHDDKHTQVLPNLGRKADFIRRAYAKSRVGGPRKFTGDRGAMPKSRPRSLENAILLSMYASKRGGAMSTTQIARTINALFPESRETSKNNVSRYFNFRPSAFFDVEAIGGTLKYSLSATGRSKARRLRDAPEKEPVWRALARLESV